VIDIISVPSQAAGAVANLEITMPVVCRIGVKDGRLVASGGLAWGKRPEWDHTRCWLWFSMEDMELAKGQGLTALRQCASMLRKAKQLGETEVYATRDDRYDTSERLLKMAGFEKTDEVLENQEVWKVTLWPL
jgi:hypothetical protein